MFICDQISGTVKWTHVFVAYVLFITFLSGWDGLWLETMSNRMRKHGTSYIKVLVKSRCAAVTLRIHHNGFILTNNLIPSPALCDTGLLVVLTCSAVSSMHIIKKQIKPLNQCYNRSFCLICSLKKSFMSFSCWRWYKVCLRDVMLTFFTYSPSCVCLPTGSSFQPTCPTGCFFLFLFPQSRSCAVWIIAAANKHRPAKKNNSRPCRLWLHHSAGPQIFVVFARLTSAFLTSRVD